MARRWTGRLRTGDKTMIVINLFILKRCIHKVPERCAVVKVVMGSRNKPKQHRMSRFSGKAGWRSRVVGFLKININYRLGEL